MTFTITQHKAYLPYLDIKKGLQDGFAHQPLAWLYLNLKGRYRMADSINHKCTILYFDSKENMEFFMLMWGEYLWNEDDLPNL